MSNRFFSGLYFLFLLCLTPYPGYGIAMDQDSTKKTHHYSFGVIPALAFDSDVGLKYGGLVNVFDHGQGSKDRYDQHLMVRLTNTTKGSLQAQLLLESKKLLPKSNVVFEWSYLHDKRLDFFGFNGRNAVYQPAFIDPSSPGFIHQHFYKMDRKLMRIRVDIHRNLANKNWKVKTGYSFLRTRVASLTTEPPGMEQLQFNTLFDQYLHWNVILPEQRKGGNAHFLSAGMIYDSRNDLCFCTHGIWFETFLLHKFASKDAPHYGKWIVTYRQHLPLYKEKTVVSFRFSSQQKLYGSIPFYELPFYFDSRLSQDGIGGAHTLRGAFRNRIVGDGFVLANLELKQHLFNLRLTRQHFSINTSLFMDAASITQTYPLALNHVPPNEAPDFFRNSPQKINATYGLGFYIVFNKHNVITINYGKATHPSIGGNALYIGSSLLF